MNDGRTNESLLERRALAEKALDGPWEVLHSKSYIVIPKDCGPDLCAVASCFGSKVDAAHIAANSPDVVMADIDEILRLRAANTWLEQEAEWLAVRCREFCMAHNWCAECSMLRGPFKRVNCESECGAQIEFRFEKNIVHDWREAARKAVARGE